MATTEQGSSKASIANPVVVFAPFGRDFVVISRALNEAGIGCVAACGMPELAEMATQDAAAVLLTEEALVARGATSLAEVLAEQPFWSDLPVLLLAGGERIPEASQSVAALRAAGNVTVLVRPVPTVVLVTAVQAALRARRRQYQVRDLMEREHAALIEAEEANRLKDQFLASVSHELRTPLSAIILWSRLLAEGRVESSRTRVALDSITQSAETQSRLIEDLLDVSRLMSGKLRLVVKELELASFIDDAIEIVRPMADAKNIYLDVVIQRSAGFVRADPDRLQQVVWNLLGNAIKFTPAGGRVSVDVRGEGREMLITISDTGQGISPDFLPHVFERFRQADTGSSRRHGGIGLGLTIAQQLVELHGGTINAESQGSGKGATFRVRLPAVSCSDRPQVTSPQRLS